MSEEWLSVADIRAAQARSSEEGLPDNHVVTIVERTLTVDIPELIQNNIKTDTVTLELDSEWDGISPVIIFECSDADYQVQYEGAATHIPQAVMKNTGSVGCSVCGYDDTGEVRLVTKAAPSTFSVVASGSFIGEISEDDVSLLGQILAAADAANAAANKVENASFAATATTLEPGESATAQITGDDLKMTVAFGIPKGETGEPGVAATIAVGTVTTGEPGTDAAVSNSGTAQAAVLDFTIPKGDAPVRGVDYWTAEDVEQVVADAKAQAVAELAEIGNVPKKTVTGKMAHADDAYAAKPLWLTVYGNTRQNLWANPSGTQNGITVTSNDDGSITLSGTASAGATFSSEKLYVLRPGSTYTLSIDKLVTGFVDDCGIAIHYYDIDDTLLGSSAIGRTLTKATFEAPSNAAYAICRINFSTDATVSGTYRVMLNEGGEAEPWCPPGLNGVDELSVVCAGKNLYKPFTNGKVTANDDGSMTVFASAESWASGTLNPINLPAGTQVTLSSDNVFGGNVGFGAFFYASDKSYTEAALYNLSSRTIKLSEDCVAYQCWFNGATGSAVTCRMMMEIGSTATSFEPYQGSTTPIDLDGHALNSLPDGTRDELTIDATGAVTLTQRVGVKVLPGDAASWKQDTSGAGLRYSTSISPDAVHNYVPGTVKSDALPPRGFSVDPYGSTHIMVAWDNAYASIGSDETAQTIASVCGGKTLLYPLDDPQMTPLSAVTLPTLPAPTFNAYSDADIPSDTSVNYARDINIVLSNLEAVQTALLGGEE